MSGSTEKRCTLCGEWLPLSAFGKHLNGLKPACKKCINDTQRLNRLENPERHLVNDARKRAKRRGIPFSITADDIHIPARCPVLGIPLVPSTGRPAAQSPSLDRLVTSLGYTKDNTIVISHRANTLKGDATLDELRRLVEFVGYKTRTRFIGD